MSLLDRGASSPEGGRTQELQCRGGPGPPVRFAPGCPGKLLGSLREVQLAAGARPPPAAAAAQPAPPPLSLPGPGFEEAVEVSSPDSWGPAGAEPLGRCTVSGRPSPPRSAIGTEKEWSPS
ncbi:uncharacterized protein [Heliangelus exortis]|uniref:uncharacterized protein isoform X2 n=1 Tax=Heliangelus exortis TaxID=472823 RepID=UPI003A8EE03E